MFTNFFASQALANVTTLDYVIIVGFLVAVIAIGSLPGIIAKIKNKGQGAADFFLGGRSMPWWLLGVSMVACTFSCDTPNLVTGMVRNNGVSNNWGWWVFLLTGMLTVFVYAKLWRRSELATDLGFYEIRYTGKPAAILRGFRSLYLGIFFNILIMATVSLAAIKIGGTMFNLSPVWSLVVASVGVAIYATLGGLTGSIWADFFQYTIAMVGAFFAAFYAVMSDDVGNISSLQQLLTDGFVSAKLAFFPEVNGAAAGAPADYSGFIMLIVLPVAVQWWACWYPGAEPGGGGYIAQRMLSAKDEKNAIGATLLFNFLHYAVRPWPWIVVALVSLTQFPMDAQKRAADEFAKANTPVVLATKAAAIDLVITADEAKALEAQFGKTAADKAIAQCRATLYPAKADAEAFLKALPQAQKDAFEKALSTDKAMIQKVNSVLAMREKVTPETAALVAYERNRLAAGELVGMRSQITDLDRRYLQQDAAYPAMIAKMPKGWLGLIVASLIAAYMSTIATHLNWGSSYFVQDFWMRFVNKETKPETAVLIGRICMLTLLVLSALVALCMESATESFNLLLQVGAGTGLLYILRWFWWRINAWSEISAMVICCLCVVVFKAFGGEGTAIYAFFNSDGMKAIMNYSTWQLIVGIIVTSIGWITVTFLTKPEPDEVLIAFCKKIRAGGPGWKRFEGKLGDISATAWDMPLCILCMVLGCLAVWTALFGVGALVYAKADPMFGTISNTYSGIALLVISVISTTVLMKLVNKVKLS